ncbi:uncharacterized protein SKDI_03G0660 [Saccharomyces kudriavzevii IFO 1802]|uniref:eRF1 domain-containing protein n=1 Tax=Saccharomyces kudriavzevii (strain ATCC MYA-4449 / AS 2.2408 / CBS 8840 / NBRC 1802 / NCYC 2889) TaxID=226230 RepID=A0AA35JC49_SACK1|nr:uncharacterized protein SKDI_03G0660 [Saccharomyces kudriavzevii IFO 1802]CAI4056557.1 hypothetical protein SKDI_03G0660 [Saccharomyces kudriavzevii IFO 1802]
MNPIPTLPITDRVLKSDDIKKRERFLDLIEKIEQNTGEVFVLSILQSYGEELEILAGSACILKYPIPNLDEILEDDGNMQDSN